MNTKENNMMRERTFKTLVDDYKVNPDTLAEMNDDQVALLLYQKEEQEHMVIEDDFEQDIQEQIEKENKEMKMTCNLIPKETTIDAVIQKLQSLRDAGYTKIAQTLKERYEPEEGDFVVYIETEMKEN